LTAGPVAAPPAGLGKSDNRTIELKYFDDLKKGGTFGKRDGLLHRWTGSHWAAIDGEQGIASAMNWLKAHHPERVNKATAKSCFESATILATPLGNADQKRCLIPLRNVYLEVTNAGVILMHKPDPSFGISYALDIALPVNGRTYVPAPVAAESLFGKFLASSLPDQEVRDYLQEGMGYTLTPFTIHQVALLLKGAGRNGKSVMVRVLSALHGHTAAINLKKLGGFALSQLFGASLAICDEVPERGLDTQTWKALISGEAVPVDRKYLSPINYRSTAKWVICTNLDQRSNDNSDGFWRRMVIIPFAQQIARDAVVPGLDQKIIETELRVVLDWCLAGLQRLMSRGNFPPEPKAVMEAKTLAVIASDPVAAWIQDSGVQASSDPGDLKTKDDIFQRFCAWCSANRVRSIDSAAFWTRLRRLLSLEPDSQHRIGNARPRCVPIRFEADAPRCDSELPPFDNS
jgi:putative DNA primase/helicase